MLFATDLLLCGWSNLCWSGEGFNNLNCALMPDRLADSLGAAQHRVKSLVNGRDGSR